MPLRLHTLPSSCKGEPTVPGTIGEELETNPFLRPHDPEIRAAVGLGPDAPDWKVFGAVRRAKDGAGGRAMLAFYGVYDKLPAPIARFVGSLF